MEDDDDLCPDCGTPLGVFCELRFAEKEIERLRRLHLERTKLTAKMIGERDAALEDVERLRAALECEWDIVGVLEQTIPAIPENGNLAIIQCAKNAIKHHKELIEKALKPHSADFAQKG